MTGDFWRGFQSGVVWTVKTFYPGAGLAIIVILIHEAA